MTTYRYTGQRENSYIKLYRMGARWYDPEMGRFTQPDTFIPTSQGIQAWDRYAYVNNGPCRYSDPSGHGACEGLGNEYWTNVCKANIPGSEIPPILLMASMNLGNFYYKSSEDEAGFPSDNAKPEGSTNDFEEWIYGGDELAIPGEGATMNCWQVVLFLLYSSGLITYDELVRKYKETGGNPSEMMKWVGINNTGNPEFEPGQEGPNPGDIILFSDPSLATTNYGWGHIAIALSSDYAFSLYTGPHGSHLVLVKISELEDYQVHGGGYYSPETDLRTSYAPLLLP